MCKVNGKKIMFIVYVKDQEKAKIFYQKILNIKPVLDVPGMTEFDLESNVSLGIIPGDGIVKILDNRIKNPNDNNDIPKCEMYLFVNNPDECYDNLIKAGGKGISNGEERPWGHYVSYGEDLDGNIIAFAK